jgi:hypothetical protein
LLASARPAAAAEPPAAAEPAAEPAEAPPLSEASSDPPGFATVFSLGLGLLALPAAEVCPAGQDQCEPGETSIALSLENLGRIGPFGFGAGFTVAFGLRPANVAPADPEGLLGREHARSYFLFEGMFRYYLPIVRDWEWWLGTTVGAVVINDSWSTLADREPAADTGLVGPRAVILATEGLALGLGFGGQWHFAESLLFGTRFRYANWFLPGERDTTPTGDSASLAGRIDIIDFGLYGGLRLPL